MKKLIILAVTLLMLTSCGSAIEESKSTSQEEYLEVTTSIESKTEDATNSVNPFAHLDTSNYMVAYDIHMTKNLIFLPNYFEDVYGIGTKYDDAIEAWGNLEFSKAEKLLLEVEGVLGATNAYYYPDDPVFVKHALGILYCDIADYKKAYDYLVDAYVAMREIYGKRETLFLGERLYADAVGMSLCHYYYEVGNFDSALKEIQSIRDSWAEEGAAGAVIPELLLYIEYEMNDIEAKIHQDRGEYNEAYALLVDNVNTCEEYIKNHEGLSMGHVLDINAWMSLADCTSVFKAQQELVERTIKYYDLALEACKRFGDNLCELYKSEILAKKGHFLCNFPDQLEDAMNAIDESRSLVEKLVTENGSSTEIINAYILYAEVYGFMLKDKENAFLYYDSAMELVQKTYGNNHPQIARILESKGRFISNRLDDTQKAIECYQEGIEIYKNLLIEANPVMARMYLGLAADYKWQGEDDLYEEYAEKGYAMYDALGIQLLKKNPTEE